MRGTFLTLADRERLNRFPGEISSHDIITFFTLSEFDLKQIPLHTTPYNRLGFAVQYCGLRYLGFALNDFSTLPASVVKYVAQQLEVDPERLNAYGERDHTRTDHIQRIMNILNFRKANDADLEHLRNWLLERALEHDRPTLLLQMACRKLHIEKILKPGITVLERMVLGFQE